jgi:TolB-like protein/regulator of sirC expression with transglutaminase-like and TPR domain
LIPSGKAVFLSYASEDAVAAERVCAALRSAGIEVWFDKSELRGGDAWDASIRQQIKTCTLFVPVISRTTQARDEGYFRLEWKLAVDRSHLIAADRAFLLPVVIDETVEAAARVPDRFREVQWTRLPGGETPPAFAERVACLLTAEPAGTTPAGAHASAAPTTQKSHTSSAARSKAALLATISALVLALAYFVADRWVLSRHGAQNGAAPASTAERAAATTPRAATSPVPAFNPPPHSIAVLPFTNMSGDEDQEYFSDGLTEELLNSLADINGLQVAARTSAFSFKGTNTNVGTIARTLNVGAVLEGSVRRSGHTIRITAQLINAVTGFDTWSKTYDRDTGDVLKLQTEIATSVASALQVTLLGDVAAKVELGGTANPAAFDAYLRGAKAASSDRDTEDLSAAIAAYTEALRLDPHYALAFAARSKAFGDIAGQADNAAAVVEGYDKALADARQALALAPDLPHAHLALALVLDETLHFGRANDEYQRALALASGSAMVLRVSGAFAALMGRFDAGLAAIRRAVVLDPLSRATDTSLGQALYYARRYQEAVGAFAEAITLDPGFKQSYGHRGLAFYGLGDLHRARASCETKPDFWVSQQCLAVVYDKLGRHADAESILSKLKAAQGDTVAYQYATIYAQWGDRAKALEWLEMAWRTRDPGLVYLKTDPLMDPLRQEPRFQAILRELTFPD